MKNVLGLIPLIAIVACEKGEKNHAELPEGSVGGRSYYIIEGGDLVTDDNGIRGSGAIVFKAPLDEIRSQDNFTLEFSVSDGGSLGLVTHSKLTLEQGLTVQFERAGIELISILKSDGTGTSDHVLAGVDASGPIALSIDVHNNESLAHVLIWSGNDGSWTEDTALYNSESDSDAPVQGKAALWGVVLRDAELKSVGQSAAKFADRHE